MEGACGRKASLAKARRFTSRWIGRRPRALTRQGRSPPRPPDRHRTGARRCPGIFMRQDSPRGRSNLLGMPPDTAAPRRRLSGWVQGEPLLAVVLWGGIYPGAKLGLAEIPVLTFTYLRVVLAALVLAAAAGGWRPPPAFPLWKPLLGAGLAQTAFQLLVIAGLQRTTAGTSAILLAAAPLLTAAWLAFE